MRIHTTAGMQCEMELPIVETTQGGGRSMSEECLKCEYATYDCQSYGACRKRWFLDRLDKDLEKNEAEDEDD